MGFSNDVNIKLQHIMPWHRVEVQLAYPVLLKQPKMLLTDGKPPVLPVL